jgi:hypothetical protein
MAASRSLEISVSDAGCGIVMCSPFYGTFYISRLNGRALYMGFSMLYTVDRPNGSIDCPPLRLNSRRLRDVGRHRVLHNRVDRLN